MKKLILLAAAAVGYVLGSRAGRQRYEQIKAKARAVWETEPVQSTVGAMGDAAKSAAADVGHHVSDAASGAGAKLSVVAENIVEKVRGTAEDSAKEDPLSGVDFPAQDKPVKGAGDPLEAAIDETRSLAEEAEESESFAVPTAEDFAAETFDEERTGSTDADEAWETTLTEELTEVVEPNVTEVGQEPHQESDKTTGA